MLEMVEIGAGGGSIASVDDLGRIRVGPRSAGSEPGPAAYGRGGMDPTVTDADIVLGRIGIGALAKGMIELDPGRAKTSLGSLGEVGEDPVQAAVGVCEVVDENMANAARTHAAESGKILEGRTLIAFGGAAPIHAARLADKLRIDRFLVPADAGVGSAVGFLLAPISYEVVRSRYARVSDFREEPIRQVLAEMSAEATIVVESGQPGAPIEEITRAYMRYVGQGHEISVDLPDQLSGATLRSAFEQAYEAVYGRLIPGLDVEVLSWTLVATAPTPKSVPSSQTTLAELQTSTVVPSGWSVECLGGGHLLARRSAPKVTPQRTSSLPPRPSGIGADSGLGRQIMWNRLLAVVEEQAQTLVRTAFSTPGTRGGGPFGRRLRPRRPDARSGDHRNSRSRERHGRIRRVLPG